MLIASDRERTSAAARSLVSLSPWHRCDDSYVGMSDVSHVFLQRQWFDEDLTHEPAELSGKRKAYSAQVAISSSSATSFISAGGGRVRYIGYGGDCLQPLHFESSLRRTANFGSWLEASMFQWRTLGQWPSHDGFSEAISSLRDVVAAIEKRSPLRLCGDTERLIQQAARAHGAPEDIASWARRLAEDVRDLPD